MEILYERDNVKIVSNGKRVTKIVNSDYGIAVDGLRELAFLNSGIKHPNITKLINYVIKPYTIEMEFYKALGDLHNIKIPEGYRNKVTLQLISAVRFLHINGVMHRDIKPENFLVYPGYNITISDFGAARLMPAPWIGGYTNEVYTMWYRAPEIIQGKVYDFTADIWSLGCTILELYLGNPLFPGNREGDVLNLIYGFRSDKGSHKHAFRILEREFPQICSLVNSMLQINENLRVKFLGERLSIAPKLPKVVNVDGLMTFKELKIETLWKALTIMSYSEKVYLNESVYIASKLCEIIIPEISFDPILEAELLKRVINVIYLPSPLELALSIKNIDPISAGNKLRTIMTTQLPYNLDSLQIAGLICN